MSYDPIYSGGSLLSRLFPSTTQDSPLTKADLVAYFKNNFQPFQQPPTPMTPVPGGFATSTKGAK